MMNSLRNCSIHLSKSKTTIPKITLLSFHRPLSTSPSLFRENFARGDQTNVNLVTLGASQHGKTTLASRLTTLLARHGVQPRTREDILHSNEERETGVSSSACYMQWWRDTPSPYRFSMADLPGSLSYVRNMLTHLPHADLVLLLVHPEHGVVQETRDHYHLSQHLGIPLILPIINKTLATDDETVELVQMELEELEGLPDPLILDNLPYNDQPVFDLITSIEQRLEGMTCLKEREVEEPFLMAVEQVSKIPRRGIFCAGRVLQGRLALRGEVEAFYKGGTCRAVVKDMEIYREGTEEIQAGDRAGAFISIKNSELELKRGAVLYDPKLAKEMAVSDNWEVGLRSLPGSFGAVQLKGDFVMFNSSYVDGKATLCGREIIDGEEEENIANLKLSNRIMAREGGKFVLRNNKGFLLGTFLSPKQ